MMVTLKTWIGRCSDVQHILKIMVCCRSILNTKALAPTHPEEGTLFQNILRTYTTFRMFCKYADCCISQDVGKLVFGRCPLSFELYTINEAHKQYSLLDIIFNYICYFEPPGTLLYLSPQNHPPSPADM